MAPLRVLVVLLVCWQAFVCGTQLYGEGTPNAEDVFRRWSQAYFYARDDIGIHYTGSGVAEALTAYEDLVRLPPIGSCGDPKSDTGPFSQQEGLAYGNITQVPLMGEAIVMAYNVPALAGSNRTLVIDRNTLGLIWAGNVTRWNDDRIKKLNPAVESLLPDADIILGYNENNAFSLTEVVRRSLESFSADFATQFALAGRLFGNLPPALRNTAFEAGLTPPERNQWLQRNVNSMTFLSYEDARGFGVPYMDMYNKQKKLVKPSTLTVQAAMNSYLPQFSAGNIEVEILDAGDIDAWPMAHMTYITLDENVTTNDCSALQELIEFIIWIFTNDGASNDVAAINQVPLDISLRKRVTDHMHSVTCNGKPATSVEFLLGVGSPIPVITSWAVSWSSGLNRAKFFVSSASVAKQRLINYDSDFAVTTNGILSNEQALMPDAVQLPATAFALVPTYNIPELSGMELVLDFDTIAHIYLGNITMWNDARIKKLNTEEVANALPDRPIRTVVLTVPAAFTQLFTETLSATVPEFAQEVGSGTLVKFKVLESYNTTIMNESPALAPKLAAIPYSFAIWQHYDIVTTRGLEAASMINTAGNKVAPTTDTLLSAFQDYLEAVPSSNRTYRSALLGQSLNSWPIVAFGSFVYHSNSMGDCSNARALADFMYWTQSETVASAAAQKQGLLLPMVSEPTIRRSMYSQLKAFTCEGEPVSALYNCIDDAGSLCSDIGECVSQSCVCPLSREGQYCEIVITSSSSDASTIALATVIPASVVMFLLLVGLIIILLVVIKRSRGSQDDWEIDYDELEVGEQLGSGGYGEVHKAMWKGTEVAVKVVASDKINKEMERGFKEEVRVMTSLRHPNVVLFMAASTKAPKMCIVMEFMSLGSLYDLLHNELVPELPFALKVKMAYQASKGMHFLHSSGIVHRDLKSLNLLLDNKWNVKVSDFGLTKFKEDIRKNGAKEITGSVHWAAPEVLNEALDVDYILADVYSFGIILWELLTREQPYLGLSPAAVAVAVIRDNIRPAMPSSTANLCPPEFEELITSCWHQDPTIRPTFLEIMTRLSAMNGGSASGIATSSSSGDSNSNSRKNRSSFSSWVLPSNHSASFATSTSSESSGNNSASVAAAEGTRPPEGEVTIVFTDITRAASLWEFNPAAMRDATLLHNDCLRTALKQHRGYEVVFIRDRNSGEGSFCMAFHTAGDALSWCAEVQQALLKAEWPEALLDHPGAAEEWGDVDDRVLFKGLRVRMGVHIGTPRMVRDPMTRRVEYIGPVVNAAARITAMTHGGQIVMSQAVYSKVQAELQSSPSASGMHLVFDQGSTGVLALGKFEMPDSPTGVRLYELKVPSLAARFFGGVTLDNDSRSKDTRSTDSNSHTSPRALEASRGSGSVKLDLQTVVGEGMAFKEDNFLTSANLCRWIIDFSEIQIGKQVGLGSYGTVYRGKWKGVDVAVKRFIKQKLDERRMLEFRAEMAFLSELHHPNIVLFIGACVKRPNLCIVTEFMKQGSLKDILATNSLKLPWKLRLRMLRAAALGINYLHSLHPVIVHRDLKPSNLLVDENWNVKVADFGFARIKEENATMTRCGTPCWTAPEVIRGEKYDERADVFSFGIIMWEMLTRKQPYAGRNFMGVSLDVLEGKRPQVPSDCPADYHKLMKKCWHASPAKRPSMEQVVEFFSRNVEDDDGTGNAL